MISFKFFDLSYYTNRVMALQGKLYRCDSIWRRCNRTEGNNHSEQLRLVIHHHSSTLYPVQPRILG